MIRNRKFLKAITAFLILETIFNTVAPTISWALTAGPTAPEFSSFEPVDTTDMVNLVTGDMMYNVPLLEVPGPSGSYPLSLAYHAGISPAEDASWVGLGWNLNTGAINRSVSGYADDHKNINGADRQFWEGGTATQYSIGVTVGSAGGAGVSAGLVYAEDTYRGAGVGYYVSISKRNQRSLGGSGIVSNSGSYTIGVSPYGDRFSSSGVGVGVGATNGRSSAMANLGYKVDQDGNESGSGSVGISSNSQSLLSASISTNQSSVSVAIGGASGGVNNSRAGHVSRESKDYSVNIPVGKNIDLSLGASYERYWIDETENVAVNGALHFPSQLPNADELDTKAFDIYDILSASQDYSKNIPSENTSGTYIDYDNYQVLGQGLSGNIKPYHFKSYLLRQNRKNQTDGYRVKSYPLKVNPAASFRFVGDFSNRYLHNATLDQFGESGSQPLTFTFNSEKVTGETGADGFDASKNVLYGSRHIEYYTNAQIINRTAANSPVSKQFMDCKATGFNRASSPGREDLIGGFMITNETGVKYHYALPVYTWNEGTYSGRVDEENKHFFNSYTVGSAYAYTWLLTSLTGPDFVDRNNNGLADQGDWGYWVNFEYGKWSGGYGWRNPGIGFNKDIDRSFDNFSKGTKQLYYLNAIKTETHTALFIKEVRQDGKGVVHQYPGKVIGGDKSRNGIDPGGFEAKTIETIAGSYLEQPTSTLRLARIHIVKNIDLQDLQNVEGLSDTYYHFNYQGTLPLPANMWYCYGKYVLDVHDAEDPLLKNVLDSKSVKSILFNSDYSLCPGTINSFKSIVDVHNTSDQPSNIKSGKLTLKSLSFRGANGVSLLPDMKFEYDVDEKFIGTLSRTSDNVFRTNYDIRVKNFSDYSFEKGEMLVLDYNGKEYYYYLKAIDSVNEKINVELFLRGDPRPSEGPVNQGLYRFRKTKNPPFSSDFHDLWNNYKVDYVDIGNEDVDRRVTSISANAVDVWSLRKIKSGLGAEILLDYESDQYNSALRSLSNIPVADVVNLSETRSEITFHDDVNDLGFQPGEKISVRLMGAARYNINNPDLPWFKCNGEESYMYKFNTSSFTNLSIISIDKKSIVVDGRLVSTFPDGTDPNKAGIKVSLSPPYGMDDEGDYNSTISLGHLHLFHTRLLGGEVMLNRAIASYGGGIRVKKISLKDLNKTRSTTYSYSNGVTPYEPMGFAVPIKKITGLYDCLRDLQQAEIDKYRDLYLKDVYARFKTLFINSRELPGPGVYYETVTQREQIERPDGVTELEGRSEFQFEVFSPNAVDVGENSLVDEIKRNWESTSSGPVPYNGSASGLTINSVQAHYGAQIKDYSSILGSLKRITLYDKDGNKVTETVNEYLHDDFSVAAFDAKLNQLKNQGTIVETFADARVIIKPATAFEPKRYGLHGIISQKIKYPSIQTGTKTINYKTGIVTSSRTLGYDFYSGAPTQTLSEDGYGNLFKTVVIPAYRKYEGMGLAALGYKNMLMQTAGTYVYKVDPFDTNLNIAMVSGNVQTWSDDISVVEPGQVHSTINEQEGIWRKKATYIFIGDERALNPDGLFPYSSDFLFSGWGTATAQPYWQKTSEVTLVDVYSNPLETLDLNEKFSSIRYSDASRKPLVSAVNANFDEFTYSGFEESNDGGVYYNGYIPRGVEYGHTGGKRITLLSNGYVKFTATRVKSGKKYLISYWASGDATSRANLKPYYSLDGGLTKVKFSNSESMTRKSGDWYLHSAEITIPSNVTSLEVGCAVTSASLLSVDDFRFQPFDAGTSSYVYNEKGELSYILGDDNLYTKFNYDEAGRLISIEKETFQYGAVVTGETKYRYQGQPD